MEKLIVSDWLASRGIFEEFDSDTIKLQVVSVNDNQKEELELLDTHKEMIDYLIKHSLADGRIRMSDDKNLSEDIPILTKTPQFLAAKDEIIDYVADLSDVEEILNTQHKKENPHLDADGKTQEELAVEAEQLINDRTHAA